MRLNCLKLLKMLLTNQITTSQLPTDPALRKLKIIRIEYMLSIFSVIEIASL